MSALKGDEGSSMSWTGLVWQSCGHARVWPLRLACHKLSLLSGDSCAAKPWHGTVQNGLKDSHMQDSTAQVLCGSPARSHAATARWLGCQSGHTSHSPNLHSRYLTCACMPAPSLKHAADTLRACRHTTEEAPGSQHSRPLEEMFAVLEAALNLRHQLQPPAADPSHQDRRVWSAEHDHTGPLMTEHGPEEPSAAC